MERVRKKSAARPEDQIQRAVFQHLRSRKAPGVFAFHVPNGGARKPIEASIMKGLGVTAGVPDVIAIRRGQAYALELKADGGKVSTQQKQALEQMEQAGAMTAVAFGLDAALRWLESNGLLIGRAA
jgi:hypothetical protein